MKPVLYLVGLGLGPRYITRAAEDVLRSADVVFVETYTVPSSYWVYEVVAGIIGRKPVQLERRELEELEGRRIFEELDRGHSVAFAVIGDPMIATTHNTLRIEAQHRGFPVRVVYGVSAHCAAISASGLFAYKFGRSATIVYPRDNVFSEYPYRVLAENREQGLHTLFYLDVKDDGGGMSIREALELLREAERRVGLGVVSSDMLVIGLARIGLEDEVIAAGSLSSIETYRGFPGPPHMLIVPANLHFMEEEAVKVYSIGPWRKP